MAFDFKKEDKEFYLPKSVPSIVEIPQMNYIAVSGKGDPNEPDGEYQRALGLLYPVAYALKMSYKGERKIDGFFEYVVPPLEGLWWTEGAGSLDLTDKSAFSWIAMIRLPDFVRREDFEWALNEAGRKKKADFSAVEFLTVEEGLCVQIMHVGTYDDEARSIVSIDKFLEVNGYAKDLSGSRRHHEIYLSDPRKTPAEKLKTVIRIPVVKARRPDAG